MRSKERREREGAPGYCGLASGPVGGTVPWTLRSTPFEAGKEVITKARNYEKWESRKEKGSKE